MLARFEFIGRATKDTEVVALKDGKLKATTSIAVNNGDTAYFFNLISFDKKAELIAKYVTKGKQVYFEGDIKPRTYEKDGQKFYTTDYVVNKVEFLSGSKEQNEEVPF